MHRMKRAGAVMVLCGALLLTGCLQEKPIVSTPGGLSNMTLTEQREWVAAQLDAAVAASEVPAGWYDIYWKDVFWAVDRPEDRELLFNAWSPTECGANSGRLDVSLKNLDADDPLSATARVRSYWEAEGFPVRDLYETHNDTEPYFIVDFEDGATFSMQASADGMSMSAHTACSVNNTVTNWQAHLDDEGNPFSDELERRDENPQPGE